jgi:enoyl-CoA hydratase
VEARRVSIAREGPVATLRLERPEVCNCIDSATIEQLHDAVRAVAVDREIRALVVTGAGSSFCAGADLKHVESLLAEPERFRGFLESWHAAFDALAALSKPTIAAVRGYALAGGLELILACDLAIVSETTILGDQHANYGLIAGGGGSQRLPRRIGTLRAKELLFTGCRLDAREVVALGLANEVVTDAQLDARVNELARELSSKSPIATGTIKRLVDDGVELDLGSALRLEVDAAVEHFRTPDALEGLAAFRAKRAPQFRGR